MSAATLPVGPNLDGDRLWARVQALSRFTRPDLPWTRRAFSPQFDAGRQWLREQMQAAGLAARIDAGGNLIGRREGRSAAAPLVSGSHCDTVLSGGRFDGIIGVLAGIEVAQSLHESGIELSHPLEIIDFLSEEPTDHGASCVGSRAFSGHLSSEMLAARAPDGEPLASSITRAGGDPAALLEPLRGRGDTAAFVELHIEQGPVLESRGLPIGVVTDIVGIRRLSIVVEGRADHAGTTPMNVRQDALVGASRIIAAAHGLASDWSGRPHYVVATVGRMSVEPNASNAVPARIDMTLEIRSTAPSVLDDFVDALMSPMAAPLEALRVQANWREISRSAPTECDPIVMDAIARAASDLGLASMRMPSGAGHDAVYVAPTGPVGMIFVPCRAGRSHCPEEWLDPKQLLDGASVLGRTLMLLDRQVS